MEAPPPPPPAGDAAANANSLTILMGKYQLGKLLGRGGFAKVHRATSLSDGSPVAIKIIDKAKPITMMMEPQIMREVAVMRRLRSHTNILKIHEVMATKTKIFLVMELASGGELLSKIKRNGRLPEGAARRYIQQLVGALRFCHENGVAHRDLKPQNLLLDQSGALKVSDFGLSALPEQLRNDGLLHTACGTPSYVAPEVLSRKGYDGPMADAWSCGVILYMLLAGHLPFDESNIVALYKRINARDYHFPEWMSKTAKTLIHRLLDPNPKTRMSIEALAATAWFKKKSQTPPSRTSSLDDSLRSLLDDSHRKECEYDSVSSMNAFDIISLSSGLNLSGLFEIGNTNQKFGKRFTSKATFETISEKMAEVGGKLGYSIEKKKGGSIGLGKGTVLLVVDVAEIAELLYMVEVRVEIAGSVDFEKTHWGGWKDGLQEIVLSWHNDAA